MLRIVKIKILLSSFAIVFIIESFLAAYTGLPYDMQVWFNTGSWMSQGINIYLPNNHIGYPPLWAFWCLAAYRIYVIFGSNIAIWRFIIKLPLILSQLALAYALGKFAEPRFDQKTAQKIFFFALTWSFIIYIGALWGQINVLSALLTFLAFYAVTNQKTKLGALILGAAIALKIFPIITLPAFFAYILKKKSKSEAGKFAIYSIAVPVIFTGFVLIIFRWDLLYFLRTVFYWTPVFQSNPVQIQGGCMNIWSFFSLFKIDISSFWTLRLIWIPVLAAGSMYWLKKPQMGEADLNLSIISLYVLFMITYGWVTEQSFVDPLPFLFLQVMAYRPKKMHLYLLSMITILVFAFSSVNWGVFIFQPLASFYPPLLGLMQVMNPANNSLIWTIRGAIGLAVSLSLAGFLLLLMKTSLQNTKLKTSDK